MASTSQLTSTQVLASKTFQTETFSHQSITNPCFDVDWPTGEWPPRTTNLGGSVPDGARLQSLHKGEWLHPRESYFTGKGGDESSSVDVGGG